VRRVRFADEDFLKSSPQYIDNSSVAGFMIEKVVLSSIALTGLNSISEVGDTVCKTLYLGIKS